MRTMQYINSFKASGLLFSPAVAIKGLYGRAAHLPAMISSADGLRELTTLSEQVAVQFII